jgi:5-methylcytosine-specific restriction endonuclease McrA
MTRPNDPAWDRRYRALLASKAWKDRRRALITKADFRCVRCKRQTPDYAAFEINHRTYERLGHERDDDLEVVCKNCHPDADKERAERSQARARQALYDARVYGWAAKKYGKNWPDYISLSKVEDEFDEWLDSKGDDA